MATQNHDTDPSTPGAKRLSDPRTPRATPVGLDEEGEQPFEDASGVARRPSTTRSRPTTDPGIAPPAGPLPVPRQPMGIVVPPATAKANDSVDLLLDGISREQSESIHTTAQTHGQSSAAYHAEHAVMAPRPLPLEEPKVVIDRFAPETVRFPRPVAVTDADPKGWGETTAVRPQPLGSRVFVAVVAGIGVVLVIFLALQRTSSLTPPPAPLVSPAAAPPPVGSASAPTIAVGAAPSSTAPVPSASGSGSREGSPPIPSYVAESLPAAVAIATATNSATKAPTAASPLRPLKPRPTPPAAPGVNAVARPAGSEVGEFKTTL